MPPKRRSSSVVRKKPSGKKGGKKKRTLTEEEMCRDLFGSLAAGNERITLDDMRRLMRIVTPQTPEAVCEEVIAVADEDMGGDIDFGEFWDLLSGGYLGERPSVLLERYKAGLIRIEKQGGYDKYLKSLPPPEVVTDVEAKTLLHDRLVDYLRRTAEPLALFRSLFDLVDETNDGYIDHAELARMVKLVLPGCSDNLIAAVARSADKNDSGDIDFEEFCSAIEDGSFGTTAEDLQPMFQRALKKLKDQGVVPPVKDVTASGDADAIKKGEDELKKMQEAATLRRMQVKADADEKKRKRLRSRLVDFYARHNPEKVREADIAKVVDMAMARDIAEDDLFRSLYRKYNLDQAGEPIEEGVESDWDASSSEVDESQLNEQELKAYHLKKEQKAEYRRAKKEEALHKAAQALIKKETKVERAMAKTARERFLDTWKSVETLRQEEKQREEQEAIEAAEAKIKHNEDVYHRTINRKVWLRALEEAKQQLFEEKCVKNDKKRVHKRLKRHIHQHRTELVTAKAKLADLFNRQIAWVQNIHILEALIDRQNEADKNMTPPVEEVKKCAADADKLRKEIAGLEKKIVELRKERNEYTQMHSAHRMHWITMRGIVGGLKEELEERQASIDIFRDERLDELHELRSGSVADLEVLRANFDAELEKLQAEVKRNEELRNEDSHYHDARARGIRQNILVYTEQCNDEIATLKQRLLELYPSILRDLASSMGKASVHGVPVPNNLQDGWRDGTVRNGAVTFVSKAPLVYSSRVKKTLPDHVVAALSVYKPRDVYVKSGAALPDEYSCVVQADDDLVFDMSTHVGALPDAPPLLPSPHRSHIDPTGALPPLPSHCEVMPGEALRALHGGSFAPLWRRRLGLTEEDVSIASSCSLSEEGGDPEAFHDVRPGVLRRWLLRTERGCTLEVTVACTEALLTSTKGAISAASPRGTSRAPFTPGASRTDSGASVGIGGMLPHGPAVSTASGWQGATPSPARAPASARRSLRQQKHDPRPAPTPPVPPPSADSMSLLSDME